MAFNFEKYGVNKPNLYSLDSLNRSTNTDLIYQNIVGRNADRGGKKYWDAEIAAKGDQGYQNMVNTLLSGKEYKDRLEAKTANPDITEQELDRLSSAHVDPYHSYSGGAVAGWVPGMTLTADQAAATASGHTDQTNFTVNDILKSNADLNTANNTALNTNLGGLFGVTGGVDTMVGTKDGKWVPVHDDTEGILGSGAIDLLKSAATTSNNFNVGDTLTNTAAGAGVVKNILDNGNIVLDITGGGGTNNTNDTITGANNNDTITNDTITGANGNDTITGANNNDTVIINGQTGEIVKTNVTGTSGQTTGTGGLTMDDLKSWWANIDKSAWTGNQQQSGGLDNFMKFMMFMSMMRPQGGGGYGGGQYGYGGLNPGGVQSAYNPMDNFQSYMDNFKSLNTGLLN